MVFSSALFLFFFLPAVLFLYFIAPVGWRNSILLFASLFFYAWGEGAYVLVMLLSIAMNYGFAIAIDRGVTFSRKIWLFFAVTANLLLFGVFKYSNFIADNLNMLISDEQPMIALGSIHLPIGISFFTFQAISYVVEVYRGINPAQTNPLKVGLYIALFPQLIAGPIVRYKDIATQLSSRVSSADQVVEGIERFVMGLGKKVLIANPLGLIADQVFEVPAGELTTAAVWFGVLCYSLQIYFDFSGYSDMAIGIGRMFGFRFLENFNYPYISQSIQEFWRRWHISLSSWFRDFLYIPLGGNKKGGFRTYLNLIIVFLLCGLWHGASWNFVIWGALHGLLLILERLGMGRIFRHVWQPVRHIYVLLMVSVTWVFFRADTLPQAMELVALMFAGVTERFYDLGHFLDTERITIFIIGVILSMPVVDTISRYFSKSLSIDGEKGTLQLGAGFQVIKLCTLTLILALSGINLIAGSHNPFIYFRF